MLRAFRSSVAAGSVLLASLLLGSCGSGGDGGNNPPPPPTLVATFEGVLADTGGTATGTLSLDFLSDNTGSGIFSVNGGVAQALDVIVNGSAFTGTGGGLSFAGTFNGTDLSASYSSASSAGLVAALKSVTGTSFVSYCASHSGSDNSGSITGVVAVVWNPNSNVIHGVWSTVGTAFRGFLSGAAGNDNALMSGHADPVTVVPAAGPPAALSGVYFLGTGESGTMSGSSCP